MIWHDHSRDMPEGSHAIFSGSKKAWRNYTPEKVIEVLDNSWAQEIGTKLHEVAAHCIDKNLKLNKTSARTLMMYELLDADIPRDAIHLDNQIENFINYVNDGIGFDMDTEVKLYFSHLSNGTADSILFSEQKRFLRIHDLKTGITPASMEQLENYAAFFCLEYNIAPGDIDMELRIYQNNEIIIANPTAEIILPVMDQIIRLNDIAGTSGLVRRWS